MDFSVLSRYDDMLASYFVDSLYLWYDTLRMNADFVGTTVDKKEVVTRIRKYLIEESFTSKAVKDAAESFLEMPYFKEYIKDLPPKQLTEFTQHMKRYLFMYRPSAGFEVGSTTRYTGKPEACILATKDWKAGEQVTCCLGSIAALSKEDDLKLKKEGRDFSVMVSIRKKCACLFLGPARFMNHDCDSNCEFILIGQNAITFRVIKDIAKGEEMTVYYADHYFGDDNCECLCSSCERLQQGHFSPQSSEENTIATTSDSEVATPPDENASNNNRRSGRKRREISYKDYYVPDNVKRAKPNTTPEIDNKSESDALIEITNADIDNSEMINTKIINVDSNNGSVNDLLPSMQIEADLPLDNDQTTPSIDVQPQFQPTDNWIYMPAGADACYFGATQELCNYISEMQNVEKRKHKVKPQEGEHILYANPPLQPHAFMPIRNQFSAEGSFQIHMPVDPDLQQVYDWMDNLSDISDNEEEQENKIRFDPNELTCCPQAKEYCMSRISENPKMCGRCNRHYQIYGLHWPLRKIKKPNKRWQHKQTGKASTPQPTTSPAPIRTTNEKEMDQPQPSSSAQSQGQQSKPQRQRRNRGTNTNSGSRKRNTRQPSTSTTTKIDNRAVSYDSDPIVVRKLLPNLSPPIICNISVPIYQNELEKSLAIDLQQQLDKEKAVAAAIQVSTKTYKVISLDKDIEDSKNRLKQLAIQQQRLLELKNRLKEEIFNQEQVQRAQEKLDQQMKKENVDAVFPPTHGSLETIANMAYGPYQPDVPSFTSENKLFPTTMYRTNLETVDKIDEIDEIQQDKESVTNDDDGLFPTALDMATVENDLIEVAQEPKQQELLSDDEGSGPIVENVIDAKEDAKEEIIDKNEYDGSSSPQDLEVESIDIETIEAVQDVLVTQGLEEAAIINGEETKTANTQIVDVTSNQEILDKIISGEDETLDVQVVQNLEELNNTPAETTTSDCIQTNAAKNVRIEKDTEPTDSKMDLPYCNTQDTEIMKEEFNTPPQKPPSDAHSDIVRKISVQSLLAPSQEINYNAQQYAPNSEQINYTQQYSTVSPTTRTASNISRRQSPTSVTPTMDHSTHNVHTTPIVFIEIPTDIPPKETNTRAVKSRPIRVVPKARTSPVPRAHSSRKGFPIALPPKEPFPTTAPITTKKNGKINSDPPPPRRLPPPTRSVSRSNQSNTDKKDSRRCSTASSIGPFIPNEYNNF